MARRTCPNLLLIAALVLAGAGAYGAPAAPVLEPIVLGVEPMYGDRATLDAFTPLCEHLARRLARPCRVQTAPNYFAYWDMIRRGADYNLVFESAHFTDYRVAKQKFTVLAKAPNAVTYSLVVSNRAPALDPRNLHGKLVATFGVPSLGAVRLNDMFRDPTRQPHLVEVATVDEGMRRLLDGKVAGAFMPTPGIASFLERNRDIAVLFATEPFPHAAFSAAPTFDKKTRAALREALLEAHLDPQGFTAVRAAGFPRFVPANASVYVGQSRALKAYWGY